MHLFIFLLLFGLIQFLMGNHEPWSRLLFIPVIPLIYLYSRKYFERIESYASHRIIIIILIILSFLRAAQFVRKLAKEDIRTEDIAVVYHESIKALSERTNPYLLSLDPYPLHYKKEGTYFDRPKYPPLQLFTYAPFVLPFGLKGIYLANMVVFLLLAWFLYHYFKPQNKHYLALVMLVGGEFFFNKLFSKGVNDLLPAYLVLLSWFGITHSKKSGVWLGLSFAAKQLPAGIFGLWYLILKKWQNFFISVPIVLVLCIPFFISDLRAAIENLVLFNILRPVRETSLLLYLPEGFQSILGYLGMLTTIFLPLFYKSRWGLPFVGLTIFIMFSKMSPGNYFIWCFPFLILWLLDRETKIV